LAFQRRVVFHSYPVAAKYLIGERSAWAIYAFGDEYVVTGGQTGHVNKNEC